MEMNSLPRVLYPIFKKHIEIPQNVDRKFLIRLHLKSGKSWRGEMLTPKEDIKTFGVIALDLWRDKKADRFSRDEDDGPIGENIVIDCDELEAASIEWVS